jgi:hypothetical protein
VGHNHETKSVFVIPLHETAYYLRIKIEFPFSRMKSFRPDTEPKTYPFSASGQQYSLYTNKGQETLRKFAVTSNHRVEQANKKAKQGQNIL